MQSATPRETPMSEAATRTGTPFADATPEPPSATRCYACHGELLEADAQVCLACGRRQTRVCFCGATISRAEALCPQCGVDWPKIRRERRPSRSKMGQKRRLLRNIAIGGALAVTVAGILYMLLYTADRSAGVLSAAGTHLRHLWSSATAHLPEIGLLALIFAVGAAGGAARYYIRQSRRRSGRRRRTKPMPADSHGTPCGMEPRPGASAPRAAR